MIDSDTLLASVYAFLPLLITVLVVTAVLWVAHMLLIARQGEIGSEKLFPRLLTMMGLTLVGMVVIVLALPVESDTRNQIVGLIGLVISAVFAFSSGNIFANLMAGILLRFTSPFRVGDFIQVGELFGRVSERGLFDTEVQSENRELIAFPNTFLVNNPISTVRSSGAIVSASLSLGYDLNHHQIRPLLLEAASASGLQEPFVHVRELGDFSISYRVSGILTEVKGLITARSNLRLAVLDILHREGIEIVSPGFMNQRVLDGSEKILPKAATRKEKRTASEDNVVAEDVMFDKAEQAERFNLEKTQLLQSIAAFEVQLKDAVKEEKDVISLEIEHLREQMETLELIIAEVLQKKD
ncbi:MAG: small-conductance mechanosensitive channel [Candidatus Azotimanducaceae bacterium]|jgi:small-conductance mechanosensitive channel